MYVIYILNQFLLKLDLLASFILRHLHVSLLRPKLRHNQYHLAVLFCYCIVF